MSLTVHVLPQTPLQMLAFQTQPGEGRNIDAAHRNPDFLQHEMSF